jgi:FYVE/RhoGEF/PH domain-containing protein 1
VALDNKSQSMFGAETLTTIFSNVKSIYKFHAEFLLPQVRQIMKLWCLVCKWKRNS